MNINQAIKEIKGESKENFDATVELHVNLGLDVKKQDNNLRFNITLPHGTGKTKKVAVLASKKVPNADLELSESDLEKIEKGTLRPRVDFDVLITEPRFMPKIAKVARILGPLGMMPNPKNGTVTEDVEGSIKEIKGGKIEIRTEKSAPIVHTILGKVSFDDEKLVGNFSEVLKNIKSNRPSKIKGELITSVFVTTTMGKSRQVTELE